MIYDLFHVGIQVNELIRGHLIPEKARGEKRKALILELSNRDRFIICFSFLVCLLVFCLVVFFGFFWVFYWYNCHRTISFYVGSNT